MVLYGSPKWAFGLYGAAASLVVLVILVLEAKIGRREDHNVDPRGYAHVGGEQGPHSSGAVPDGAAPSYREVNWNGEIKGERRKMMRF